MDIVQILLHLFCKQYYTEKNCLYIFIYCQIFLFFLNVDYFYDQWHPKSSDSEGGVSRRVIRRDENVGVVEAWSVQLGFFEGVEKTIIR